MTSPFNKLVLAAALISPLLLSAPANASMSPLKLDQTAVTQLTTSVKHAQTAYQYLAQGNKSEAQKTLNAALRQIEGAVAKDKTLGVANVKATAFHSDLKRVQSQILSTDSNTARSELRAVLQRAGIQTMT